MTHLLDKVEASLREYIESEIIPRYGQIDAAHDVSHIIHVIDESLSLAEMTGVDINMSYVIAAYHDLGNAVSRERHHIISGEILEGDSNLRRWFTDDEKAIMREAVEDHRASLGHEPRSIYGKIVADADRDLSPATVIRRTIQFGKKHYSDLTDEQHYERARDHIIRKYGTDGYMRLNFDVGKNVEYLRELREIVADEERFRRIYDEVKSNIR